MRIAFFGSSLVSAYWNGAATYYRGIVRALDARGHQITFYEPDAYGRQQHRDIADPAWADVVVYPATERGRAVRSSRRARGRPDREGQRGGCVRRVSGGGGARLKTASNLVAFWDVDAPATLDRVQRNPGRSVSAL